MLINTILTILLFSSKITQKPDTTVTGGILKEAVINSSRTPHISVRRVSSGHIKTMPFMLGEQDILKAAQSIPGITGGKEGNAGIMIRGGEYDQTDFLLDGGSLFNPAHLLGFVSSINSEVTSSLDVYKGELPAWFGGRLSGVVDVHGKNGDFSHYHGGGTAGILSSNFWAEGPVINDRLSFIAGVRKSYFNLMMYPLYRKIADKGSYIDAFDNLGYFDASLKLSYKASDHDFVSLSLYTGRDRTGLGNNKIEGTSDIATEQSEYGPVKRDDQHESKSSQIWGNTLSAMNWNHDIQNGGKLTGMLSYSFFRNDFVSNSHSDLLKYAQEDGKEKETATTKLERLRTDQEFLRRNGINETKTDIRFNNTLGGHEITLGTSVTHQGVGIRTMSDSKTTLTTFIPTPSDKPARNKDITDSTSHILSLAIYADDRFQLFPGMVIRGGIRGQTWMVKGRTSFIVEPRASVKWTASKSVSVAMGYNKTSQSIHQISSSAIMTPGDVWVPSTSEIKPSTASQVYMEVDTAIPCRENPFVISIEAYHKTMNNLLEWTDMSLVETGTNWADNISTGKGTTYGVEVSSEKEIGKFYTSLAYTWSRSTRQFDDICDGRSFFAANDRRNDLKIQTRFEFSKKWDMSASFTYHTGDRFTLDNFIGLGGLYNYTKNTDWVEIKIPSIEYHHIYYQFPDPKPGVTTIPINISTNERNNYKMKDYHRMDISINYHMYHRHAQSTVNVSIYNVYNRLNPYTLQYDRDENNNPIIYAVCIMPFMPSLTYTLRF